MRRPCFPDIQERRRVGVPGAGEELVEGAGGPLFAQIGGDAHGGDEAGILHRAGGIGVAQAQGYVGQAVFPAGVEHFHRGKIGRSPAGGQGAAGADHAAHRAGHGGVGHHIGRSRFEQQPPVGDGRFVNAEVMPDALAVLGQLGGAAGEAEGAGAIDLGAIAHIAVVDEIGGIDGIFRPPAAAARMRKGEAEMDHHTSPTIWPAVVSVARTRCARMARILPAWTPEKFSVAPEAIRTDRLPPAPT